MEFLVESKPALVVGFELRVGAGFENFESLGGMVK